MKTHSPSAQFFINAKRSNSMMRIALLTLVIALIGIPLFSSTSVSSAGVSVLTPASKQIVSQFFGSAVSPSVARLLPGLTPAAETIETFAADCTTPRTAFYLGDTVCAKASGVTETDRFVNWLDPNVAVFASGPVITTDPHTTLQTLPTGASYVGTWKATIADPSDSSIIPAPFTVSEQPPIATYASPGCTVPKTNFVLGEKVCVKVAGVPVNVDFPNKISWVDTVGFIEARTNLVTDPQTDEFQLPSTDTSTVNDQTVDNRGVWRVHVTRNNGRLLYTALFNVSSAANPAAHLTVRKFSLGTEPTAEAGSNISFVVTLTNKGPEAATTVHLTDPTPANMTLVSFTQTSGPALTCSGADCTIASLAVGATAEFLAEYTVGSGTAGGTIIENTALVTSPVSDPDDTERTATAAITVTNDANQATCALECPGNINVTANTTQGSETGAFVTFASAEPSGDCGAVTANPASGSFFSTGSHTVTVTSATGGGSCSFIVSVVEAAAPTITCPLPDLTAAASGGATETTVSVSTPAATGNNVTVTSNRSDGRLVTDPYPVGTTIISWLATEHFGGEPGRQASCNQKVIVTSPDAPTISCPSDKSFNANDCTGRILTSGEIGSPSTTGVNVVVTARRSDSHDLYADAYPVGVTSITWTGTDAYDRVVSCIQQITIAGAGDTTPPTLSVPASISISTDQCSLLLDDELGVATAEDSCSSSVSISRTGVPTVACPTPSEPNKQCESFVFPTGTTVITYTATDGSGNVATGTQTVTLTESPAIPPTITAPADVSVNTGPGATSCGTVVGDATLGSATASDNCPGVTVVRTGVPAGNIFPVGTTVVTYTATDRSGNTANDTQSVTVVDDTVPVVTPPAAVTAYTGAGATSCGTVVSDATLGSASATDNCPGVGAISRTGVPSGNNFPVGTTVVTYAVTDAHGNSSSATQNVTVIDNTAPILTPPAAVTAYTGPGATSCGTVVSDATLGSASASDNCPGIGAISRTDVPSGNVFPVGSTTVNYSVTDAHGNTTTATQTVTVIDNTVPVISCPSNITLEPTCPSGAIATYTAPVGTDNCPGATTTRTAGLASGSVFPIGTTTVTHTVDDAHGNSASCSFTVTVLTPQAVIQNLINSVNASSLTGTQKNGLLSKLNAALSDINGGNGNACAKLSDFVNSVGTLISHGDLSAAQGNAWISSANHVRNTIGCTNLPCS